MACITQEDLINSLKNHKALFNVHDSDTLDQVIERLDALNQNFEKTPNTDFAYSLVGTTEGIKKSVNEKGSNKFDKKKFTPSDEQSNTYKQQAEIGNFVHDVSEELTKEVLKLIENKSTKESLSFLKTLTTGHLTLEGLKKIELEYGRTVNRKDTSLDNSLQGVINLISDVYKQQNLLNKKTGVDAKPIIRLEQKVIDARTDVGGTIDFLGILSDKSALIRDYKTKIPTKNKLDEFGNLISTKSLFSRLANQKNQYQIGEYGRILQKAIGITGVRSSGIVPVLLNVNYKNGQFGSMVSGIKFPGQDKMLEEIRPFAEKTGFNSLDEFIKNIQTRISALEAKINVTKDKQERERLSDRIEGLQAGKKDILINHSLNKIVSYAHDLNEQMKNANLGNLSIDELMDLRDEISALESLSKSTYEYRQHLKTESGIRGKELAEQMEAQINQIISELNDRYEDLTDLMNEQAIALVQEKTGYNITDESGDVLPFHSPGFFGKYYYQLSQHDNPVFQTLRRVLDEANFNKKHRLEEIFTEVQAKDNAVFNWLDKSGKSRSELVKILINPLTDNFWSKFSADYTKEVFDAKSEDLPKYFDIKEGYQEWFNSELSRRENRLRQDPANTEDFIKAELQRFRNYNDLSVNGQKANYPNAWENLKRFLIIKDGQHRPEYDYIQSVPELKAYYDMFEKYNTEFRDLLGVEYKNLPNNFLPNIRKTFSERLDEFGGIKGMASGVKDFVKDFQVRQDDEDTHEFNGEKSIPKFYLNQFKDKDGKLQVGEKSYQFGRSLMLFANMALNYNEMTKAESQIVMLKEFLSEQGREFVTRKGKIQRDSVGNPVTTDAKDSAQKFETFVDMYLYGVGVKPELFDKDGKAEKMLLKAKEYFTLKSLGFNVIAGAGGFLAAKLQAVIEGNKGIFYTKTQYYESLKDAAVNRSKLLALTAFFDPMGYRTREPALGEHKYGAVDIGDESMRGWVNKYVNSRLALRVFSMGDEYIDEVINASMAKNFYIDDKGNLRKMKTEEDYTKWKDRTIWNLFTYENGVPKLNLTGEAYKNAFINFRRAAQVGQSKIKGTIPEEDKAYWQSQLFGSLMMQFKSWMPGVIAERFGKVHYDSRIDSVYMGRYVALSQELGEWGVADLIRKEFLSNILLPKLGQFIKQLAYFGKMNDVGTKRMMFEQWLEENPHMKGKVEFEEFNDIQQKQLKGLMSEIRILLAFAAIMLLLGSDIDHDGEKFYKKYLLTRKLAALIFKTNQEMSFTFNPIDFVNMVKTPLPAIGMITDLWKAIRNTLSETKDVLTGEDELFSSGKKGKDKTGKFYYTSQLIPGGKLLFFFDLFREDSGEQYK